jgi:hypothetical protein
MNKKTKKLIDQTIADVELIFETMKTEIFTTGTIDALARFYKNLPKLPPEIKGLSSPDGEIGVVDSGVGFHLHDSDIEYHYCADCGEITKHTIAHSSETILIS